MFKAITRSVCNWCRKPAGAVWRKEKGQVMPIALAVLALGTLVIAPFLSHASTTLISSRQYQQSINEVYTCESAIEQAIWALTHDTLEGELSEIGSTLNYNLDGTVNALTGTVTIDWLDSVGDELTELPGQILDDITDSSHFADFVFMPRIIRVSDNVFAAIYFDVLTRGVLVTFEISPEGVVSPNFLDSCIFSALGCYEPDIIAVSGDIFAVVFRGLNNNGFVKTVTIDGMGQISQDEIDTLEFENSNCYEPRILHISGTVFSVAYQGSGDDGWIKTLEINNSGQISNNPLDSLEFDVKSCDEPVVFQVSGQIYGVAYRGQSNDGTLSTFSISDSGQIGNSIIDSLEFDSGKGYQPSVLQVGSGLFAVTYRDQSHDGFLKTLRIETSGAISDNLIDSLNFNSVSGSQPNLIYISGNIYGIVYQGWDTDGYVSTLTIESSGQIGENLLDTLQFDNAAYDPQIIHVGGNIFAVIYRGSWFRGYIKTIDITTGSVGGNGSGGNGSLLNTFLVTASAGDTVIAAKIAIAEGIPTIKSWDINPH